MRIMIFDVPAECGGALSVLQEFYREFEHKQDNEYIFVLSLPKLKEMCNIRVLKFPWVKKSGFHRLYFDYFTAPRLIKKYKVDYILSLQNTIIPCTKVYQSVFVHNALPFSDYKFSLKEDRLLWIYQNIIGGIIKKSIKKADHIIVQTNWMKRDIIEQLNMNDKKIEIRPPKVDIETNMCFEETKESLSTFFYPASGVVFKNHKIIIEACLKMKEEGINDYRVIFTLKGNENKHVKLLHSIAVHEKLPIEYVGSIEKSTVFELYTKSILLFPSYIETVGLPLLEAKLCQTPIIASSCKFTHEILDNYKKVSYFDPFDVNSLKNCLLKKVKG